MAKHLCPNTTCDQTKYSAPVPFIGLYIAAATLVCFLLILCDVIHGFRRRKTWFPCRFFALNSVTLTLLGIAAKLPVDLTTSMPSAYDQLSKLIGFALICVCMGFFMPSLGSSEPSECITNLAALTILVVTVVVNICIQMSTGIIFSFIPELVIIMYCTLVMLINLWVSTSGLTLNWKEYTDNKKNIITNGEGSMLHRLKLCYLYCCLSEPQLEQCKRVHTLFASGHCFLCFAVVLEAVFRSLISHELEFCNGLSDYGWSMRIIIFTQILVIFLASIVTVYRPFGGPNFIYCFLDLIMFCKYFYSDRPTPSIGIGDYFRRYLKTAIFIGYLISAILCLPLLLVLFFICAIGHVITFLCDDCFGSKDSILDSIPQEHIDFLNKNCDVKLEKGALRKGLKDMKIWTSGSEKNNSSSRLGELLSKRPPSQHSLDELTRQYGFKEGNEVSCLYLVCLVRLVSVSIPSALDVHLVECLNEVFDIIYFVDHTMNSSETINRWRCKYAKGMWKGKVLKTFIAKESPSDVDHALKIIKETENVLISDDLFEVTIILKLINDREYASIQELYDYMEQLFIDMLLIFLIQLPHAIVKEVVESHAEVNEETVGRVLKLLCQIKHLEDKVQWSFPVGSNITRLITAEASVTNQHITSPVVHNDSSNVVASHVMEDEDHNVHNVCLHEIVQIE